MGMRSTKVCVSQAGVLTNLFFTCLQGNERPMTATERVHRHRGRFRQARHIREKYFFGGPEVSDAEQRRLAHSQKLRIEMPASGFLRALGLMPH